MGRDWSWLGGRKKKSSSKSKKDIKAAPPPSSSPAGETATAAGCMSAVFNIFDLQPLQFPINHHHLHLPKGVDKEESTPSSHTRKDGNLNISMGIKIKTKPQARSSSPSSSLAATESYSPSVKTPTLVARLMGLDLVPDNYISSSPTPSSSSSSHTTKHRHYSLQRNSIDGGTRSLPETPKISLGRRSLDVNSYQHQRSSLHLREMKIHVEDKENRSPRDYARQIVMQLKENVSRRRRRMGTDITNKEQPVQEPRTKPKSSLQRNNVPNEVMEKTVKVQDKTRLQKVKEEPQGTEQVKKQSNSDTKCKKAENFTSRLVKPSQTMQEQPFLRSTVTINNIKNKDALKLRVTQSSRNRASTTEFTAFQRQTQTHIAQVTKRTLVLEGVDVLVAGGLSETETQLELAFEGEGIVTELERGIFEALVAETTTDCLDTWNKTVSFKRNADVSGTWGVHVTRHTSNVGSHCDSFSLFREKSIPHDGL